MAVPPVFLQESEEEEKVEEDPIFTGEFYKDLVRFLSKMDPLQEVMDNLELMPFPSEKPEAAEVRGLKFVLNAERQVPVCKWLLGEQDGEAREALQRLGFKPEGLLCRRPGGGCGFCGWFALNLVTGYLGSANCIV